MTGTTKAPRRPARTAAAKAGARSAPPKAAPSVAPESVASPSVADLAALSEDPIVKAPVATPSVAPSAAKAPAAAKTGKPAAAKPGKAPAGAPVAKAPVVAKAISVEVETAATAPSVAEQPAVETVVAVRRTIEQKGKVIMSDVLETTKKYADEAKAKLETAFSELSSKTKANVEKSAKALEEFSDLAKGNVEAMVESGKIASKGLEGLGQEAAEYGRSSFEKVSSAMKSLAAVKSPAEFFQLQSELFSTSFDSFAKETAKTSETVLKLAGDVVQPISTRISVVTEKVRSLSA